MPAWVAKEDKLRLRIIEEEARADQARLVEHEKWRQWRPRVSPITEIPEKGMMLPEKGIPPTFEQPIVEENLVAPIQQAEFPSAFETPEEQWAMPETTIPEMRTPAWSPPAITPAIEPQAPTVSKEAPPTGKPIDYALWEKPKEIFTGVERKVGGVISKVPILPKVLEKIAPIFEFIHEKLEKPFAAIITSPLSPSLSWRSGESWLDHEKREYDAWEAPTYVKGISEFAMPLWWLPYFGWAARGAKALGIGGKAAAAMAKANRIVNIAKDGLPSSELLNVALFKNNLYSKFARWGTQGAGRHFPGLKKVIELTAGVGAGVSPTATDSLSVTVRALRKAGFVDNMRDGVKRLYVPKLQVLGRVEDVLGMNSKGVITNIVDKSGKSQYLYDVLEGALNKPENYTFLKGTKKYVDELRHAYDDLYGLLEKEGFKRPKEYTVHRMVKGKENPLTGQYEKSEYGSLFEKERRYLLQKQGVEGIPGSKIFTGGVDYGLSINESLSSTFNHYIRKIARTRFEKETGALGKTAKQMFIESFPEEAGKLTQLLTTRGSAKYAKASLSRVASYAGKRVPSAVMAKIRRELPEIAEKVDRAFLLSPEEVNQVISKVAKETQSIMKIKPAEFKDTLYTITNIADAFKSEKTIGRILRGEIDDAIQYTNTQAGKAAEIGERIYKEAYNIKRKAVNDAIKEVRGSVDNILEGAGAELKPLTLMRNNFLKHYEGKQIIGEGLAKFSRHPVFKETIFPKEVVATTEKLLNDSSQEWLRVAAGLSGVSRMLTAAMDLSNPFIQGLAVGGRNPVAWAGMMAKNLEFFFKPNNFYKYLTDPKTMAVASERILLGGGSSTTFEFFNALAPLQRFMGKIPVVGKPMKWVIGETYGRAEVAFSGSGEAARNYMWQALRKPNMTPDALLDLGRTIDRMTGVMSTEALTIGRSQQDFENAFVFFAPRYTRAGLSFAADALRGGMAGAEARKSLGMLMAGGLSMYYGTCKALGQQPNLNPNSGRFLTIKIGDSHFGIGGIMVSLMRFGYDVAATAIEDPINLVKPISEGGINRWDNPFLRFMYAKSAPLTGMMVSTAVEQANYFGEPFEGIGDWGKFMAYKVLPIWTQGTMEDPSVAVGVAQFAGLRVFPKSSWELLDEVRDKLAIQEHGQPYANLNDLQQTRIDKNDAIRKLQVDVDAQTVTRGDAISVGFLNRERERTFARQVYEETVWNLQRAYDDGVIDGVDFRDKLRESGYGLGTTYQHIDAQSEYKDVLKTLKEPKEMTDKHLEDIAYSNFMDMMYKTDKEGNSVFEDKYGLFQYDKYNQFLEEFRTTYGDEIYQYVMDKKVERDADMPPLYKEYQIAKEVMKPYWEIKNTVERLFGKQFAESSRGQAFIAKQRKALRLSNTEIEKYYSLFYKQV